MLCSHNAHVCDFASPPIRFHQQRQYRNRLAAPAPLAPVPMAFAAAPQHFCGLKHDGNKAALSFILSPSATEFVSLSLLSSTGTAACVPTTRTAVSRRPKRKPTRASPKASSTVVASLSSDSSAIKKGSKFCVVDGCMSRAKHAKRCWRHGGSVKCKVVDCDNRAKSKGVCWSHGGGTLCSFERCDTISVSNGFCWAHGGGKRCAVHACSKPAYERTQNYCTAHYEEHVGAAAPPTATSEHPLC